MSKRILVEIGSTDTYRRDAIGAEGTNLDLIRIYGGSKSKHYAVIIADDNLFEGL